VRSIQTVRSVHTNQIQTHLLRRCEATQPQTVAARSRNSCMWGRCRTCTMCSAPLNITGKLESAPIAERCIQGAVHQGFIKGPAPAFSSTQHAKHARQTPLERLQRLGKRTTTSSIYHQLITSLYVCLKRDAWSLVILANIWSNIMKIMATDICVTVGHHTCLQVRV